MKNRTNKNRTQKKVNYGNILAKTNLFLISDIVPLTDNQQLAFDYHNELKNNLVLNGFPGTGKTFLAIYMALLDVLNPNSPINHIKIIRSTVSSRDEGFLPGSPEEKLEIYTGAYSDIFNMLFGRDDAFIILKKYGIVSIESTSYLRSKTFDNTSYILDEMQNCKFQELDTFITRTGENTRLYLCGDYYQSDLTGKDKYGVLDFLKILYSMDEDFKTVQFEREDCVRNKLVRNYLIKKAQYEKNKHALK